MPRSVTVTMIRHGESLDNLTGQRDAPLSNHGYNQSIRLGQHFADTPITAIYTSDLARAQTTARNVAAHNKSQPPPPVIVSPLLREQFFGLAEGSPWNSGAYSSHHLPWEDHRQFKLAEHAESLNQVGKRADLVLRHFVLPHVVQAAKEFDQQQSRHGQDDNQSGQHHVLLVAHGIWLSEMMYAFKRAEQGPQARFIKTGGYQNTGWSRLQVELSEGSTMTDDSNGLRGIGEIDNAQQDVQIVPNSTDEPGPAFEPEQDVDGQDESVKNPVPTPDMPQHIASLLPTLPPIPNDRHLSLPPPFPLSLPTPRLKIKVVALHQAQHLEGLKRTKGQVRSSAWDDKQTKLKDFFAGGGGGGGGE
ncbi:hypothetical protein OIV83_004224 [Microbotryomycetes sp. JL201]|nr:hypothetical protein OIV83_004224 [Microbotryomycetes sp. JL201]